MSTEEEGFEVGQVKCIWATEASIKCRMLDSGLQYLKQHSEFWIPQTQVHDDSEVYRLNDQGLLIVKAWWARKEGWEDS